MGYDIKGCLCVTLQLFIPEIEITDGIFEVRILLYVPEAVLLEKYGRRRIRGRLDVAYEFTFIHWRQTPVMLCFWELHLHLDAQCKELPLIPTR